MEYEKFRDYMYYLLTSPFKKIKKAKNQWYILFTVLGDKFDESMESIYKAQEQSMLATCEELMLQEHAKDRNMKRYAGESDENFRVRIANYSEVLKLGGTDAGVILAIKSLGFNDVQIVPTKIYKHDNERWAEFHILIRVSSDEELPIGYDILRQYVRKSKRVTALDNYEFTIEMSTSEKNKVGCYTRVIVKAARKQGYIMNNRTVISCKSILSIDSGLILETKHDLWRFDGAYLFDGSKKLDAWQSQEDL